MQGLRGFAFLLVVVAAMASGCVVRTTTRQMKLSEMKDGKPGGQVVSKETIWIWQREFWNP